MQESYPKHTHCLISDSTDLRPLKGYEKDYLVKSKPLGFVFCLRIPTEEELQFHYAKYGRDEYYSPITRLRYSELLDSFEPFRKTGKILDVGCGTGFFLEVAKEKGWEVYGTEYTTNAVEICRSKGIKMQQGRLNTEWYTEEMFDVVTSFEVMEHIYNPKEEVQNIHKVSRKGGLFYITTPNFNAVERFMLKGKYDIVEYPEHLGYFTVKTINYLLSRNRFKKRKIKTTGISFARLKIGFSPPGKNTSYRAASGTDESIREKSQSNVLLAIMLKLANGILNLFRIGNSLKAWYIRE